MKKLISLFILLFLASVQVIAVADDRKDIGYHGLDLSHHNGAVDWSKLSSDNIGFVFVKATEGMDDKDPSLNRCLNTVCQ